MNVKKVIYIISFIIVVFVFGTFGVISSAESDKLRRLNNQLTERINDAEDTNRRLAETVGQCQSICSDLEQSVTRNITTATEAVNLIEEVREEVYALESVTGGFDIDKYYSDTDKYLGIDE